MSYDSLRATGWSPQKHLFFHKSSFWLSSKSSQSLRLLCLDSCFCVFMCDSSLKFSPKDHGRSSDMEKSLQSCCGPFRELEKMVKLRQIRQNPEIVAKNSRFFLFSICFFSFFFKGFSFLNQI